MRSEDASHGQDDNSWNDDGVEPEISSDSSQDITDPVTGLSRLLSEKCATCILRPGDKMHLGPKYSAAFIRKALDKGSYVVCHETLTYGDYPTYGPAICRGFFDGYADRAASLLVLRAYKRLIEIPPPTGDEAGPGAVHV
jgi:hypothetical protein